MRLARRMVRGLVVAAVMTMSLGSVAWAQRPLPQDFQIEWKKRTDPFQRPGIEGWVSNPSGYRVGSMLLRVQTLDGDRKVTAERKVWVYGHVPPGGRTYFVVPLTPDDRATYQIVVDSFDLISLEAP